MVDVIFALSVIAAAFALYYKIQYGRGLRKLIKMFEEQQKRDAEKKDGD